VNRDEAEAAKSFRNLDHVQIMEVGEMNAYDVLVNDWIIFTTGTLPQPKPADTDEGTEA
jgi:large subunit ribosomal protein L4